MDGMSYKEVLKSALMMCVKETVNDKDYESSEKLQGIEIGLLTAIEKLEASSFLLEGWKEA